MVRPLPLGSDVLPFLCAPHTHVHTHTTDAPAGSSAFPLLTCSGCHGNRVAKSPAEQVFRDARIFSCTALTGGAELNGVKTAQRVTCGEGSWKRLLKDTGPTPGGATVEDWPRIWSGSPGKGRMVCGNSPLDPAGCGAPGGRNASVEGLSCGYPSASLHTWAPSLLYGWRGLSWTQNLHLPLLETSNQNNL